MVNQINQESRVRNGIDISSTHRYRSLYNCTTAPHGIYQVNNHLSYRKNKQNKPLQFRILENRNQIFFDLPTIKKNLILLPPSIFIKCSLFLSLSCLYIQYWRVVGYGRDRGNFLCLRRYDRAILARKRRLYTPGQRLVFGPAQG